MKRFRIVAALAGAGLLAAAPAAANMTKCKLQYTLKGWSAIYKEYRGGGTVTCANGQTAKVKIVSRGGGFTFGKTEIDNGTGTFSEVKDIEEVFGSYAAAKAGAAATDAAQSQVMTKGEVSLALSGVGRGMEIDISFGSFTIERQ